MSGIEMIADERKRQVDSENWTAAHDDEHANRELAAAAVCYAAYAMGQPVFRQVVNYHAGMMAFSFVDPWPWDESWDKRDIYTSFVLEDEDDISEPTDEQRREHDIRCLVKAGALIAAEIDRLQRLPVSA